MEWDSFQYEELTSEGYFGLLGMWNENSPNIGINIYLYIMRVYCGKCFLPPLEGGYVFGNVCLFVCLSVSNITQNVISGSE